MNYFIRHEHFRSATVAIASLVALLSTAHASSAQRGHAPVRRADRAATEIVPSASATGSIASGVRAGALTAQSTSTCQPGWISTFGGAPGTNERVTSFCAFDDGSGPALYVGGYFTIAGGVLGRHIAKWDGSRWSALGDGMNLNVYAMTGFDDGSGPALYVGGAFMFADGVSVNHIAKWNGSSWSALGGGAFGDVRALTVFDDGSGPALYAGGNFLNVDGMLIFRIAKWNGSSWSALAGGMDGEVDALTVFDDGGGPALYAAGAFLNAGGVAASRIAKWNGTSWSALGAGIGGALPYVNALTVFDDGTGPALYAGGRFTVAGGASANRVAKWDGTSWSPLAFGVNNDVNALVVFDDGGGSQLYAGGLFTTANGGTVTANSVARWNGSSWSQPGNTVSAGNPTNVAALAVFDAGTGPKLCAGGDFMVAEGVPARRIAKWDGATWSPFGNGVNSGVQAAAAFDDGGGTALYAGGFTFAGAAAFNRIAKWNGSGWSALGSGVDNAVNDLAVFDDGGGPALFAGGSFGTAGGVLAPRIAKWNGASWSGVGAGLTGPSFPRVNELLVFDDGTGSALYACGSFATSGVTPVNNVAKWNGASWSALGTGLNNLAADLCAFDDGGGSALYVCGSFTDAGGVAANHIAKWSGTTWSALGSGLSFASALTVFDDGSGPALYVGGSFGSAGGVAANNVAKWNGSNWSAVGGGVDDQVFDLATFDDGSGSALYAVGNFNNAGGVLATHIAKWDGSSWSAMGIGLSQGSGVAASALDVVDDGSGPALYAGGGFLLSPAGDSYFAKWGNVPGCGMPGTSLCEPGSAGVIACPCGNAPSSSGVGCNNSSNTGGAALSATGIARLSYDTVEFTTSGEKPTATSIVLQGNAASSGAVFGQGVRCVTGNLKRLYVKTAAGGSITAPQGSDLSVHDRSSALGDTIAPGTHRYYGVYYRDPTVLGGCPSASTFNITQQLDVLWGA